MKVQLHNGDCIEVMRSMPDNSVDAVVTDPPYGLSFMGKKWDYDVPSEEVWRECLRVLKPGGHLLAFAGTRTQHRMACRIEDAGFEIRDMIAWVYGSGFPKSLDVSKAIDNAAGVEREVVGRNPNDRAANSAIDFNGKGSGFITTPTTPATRQWAGWGTALKPALEPITMARKPFTSSVAANIVEHGTGAINVDGCRVHRNSTDVSGWSQTGSKASNNRAMSGGNYARSAKPDAAARWPANLIHDDGDEVQQVLGDASRFFYCAKASKSDRDAGLEGMPEVHRVNGNKWTDQDYRVINGERPATAESGPRKNIHPTVKPTDLMRYLCRLVTQPGGVVLDPFMGSGSTGKAALLEGFRFVGIERDETYFKIAKRRISNTEAKQEPSSKQGELW